MTAADPARVLRRAVLAWGLGHLSVGRGGLGWGLLVAEIVAAALVAWLTIGLADTNLYLLPFLGGVAFLVVWAAQAIHAYLVASARQTGAPRPDRSPALAIGWLTVPLLAWGSGFWLIGTDAATPSAVLDRFVTEWNAATLDADEWPAGAVASAEAASDDLGSDAGRLRDVRIRIASRGSDDAIAVAEAIHFERRESRFLWIFPGTELVPVADRQVLSVELVARPAELPGGGDIGAVRWEIVDASRP